MKAIDLIKALKELDPNREVVVNIIQYNKSYGIIQLPINYGYNSEYKGEKDYHYYNAWVNKSYGGSITVHLPKGAYIAKLPK